MKQNNNITKINLSFFMLLIVMIQVIITDTIIYFAQINYIIANVLAIILNILIIILLRKKKMIKIENKFNKWDLFFLILILIIIITTIIFPDDTWDSYSYHIYLQQNPFADKIYNDFFPGRTLTSFVFPLADRVFYLFRFLLGFRLGTLPSYLLLIVIFYQIKKILKKLINKDVKEMYLSILSIFPLGTFIILQQLGTYYIDNFSIAILLEIIYIIFYDSDKIFKNKPHLYYLALLVGIATCIKITNAIYIIFPLICLLTKNIKDIKQIKWYDYPLLIITFFIPMLPYFLDAIIQTGSPVFPYYNTIFKSKYFAKENWLDTRYGPKNLIQFILWPLYIIKYPEKAYESGNTDLSFATGFIAIIIYLLYVLYKRIIKKEKIKRTSTTLYMLNLLYFYLVWEKFIIGYTRYAGIITIFVTIFIIKLFIDFFDKKNKIATLLIGGTLVLTAGQGISQYIYYGPAQHYVLALNQNEMIQNNIKTNFKKIFHDKKTPKYDIDGIWGVIYDDSAVPTLLNVDDRLVHLEYGKKTGETKKTQSLYWDNVLNNDIYVPLYTSKLDRKLEYLDSYHFKITEITDIIEDVSFLQWDSKIYIVKVKYEEIDLSTNKYTFEKLLRQMNEET